MRGNAMNSTSLMLAIPLQRTVELIHQVVAGLAAAHKDILDIRIQSDVTSGIRRESLARCAFE